MKRFVAVLSSLLVLPAFAEVAPIYYDEVIEYSEDEVPASDVVETAPQVVQPVAQPSSMVSRSGSNGRAASRVSPSVRGSTNSSARGVNARTSAASRNATQARTGVQSRTAATSRATASRTAATNNARVAQRAAAGRVATNTPAASTSRRGTAANGARTARSSIVQTDTVNAPLYTGRVSTRSSAVMARAPVAVSAGNLAATTATAATPVTDAQSTINQVDELAQMSDYCKAQYTSCMDNYCNVLDDNQGRCTCSKNIKNYEKTEAALKEATEALQDVAQQIQYIGLTGDDIETLFSQTEAEIQMQATTDNTQLKNSLDSIRDLIVEVKTGTATSSETGLSFDLSGLLDFNISGSGFDLGALFGTTTANTSSISNQRGEQLYKTAAARCKTAVLTTCQNQGVDISVITNAYDMEIDKQCIAYERNLNEANDNMNATVRNAKTVLQKARLMVAQQKNAYDLRGCVNALDSCMQDEFVCGTDYENCLDPTGKYIVSGEVAEGSTPGLLVKDSDTTVGAPLYNLTDSGLYSAWNYSGDKKNAWYGAGSLSEYIDETVTSYQPGSLLSTNIASYILDKIGYNQDGRNYGMCISILNKCQLYTYDKDGDYETDNMVIREYLARTLTQIKSAQDEIISDYASGCMIDVETCLGKNNYNSNNNRYSNAAINACRSQIITCMSVNGDANKDPTPAAIRNWVDNIYKLEVTEEPEEETNGGSGSGSNSGSNSGSGSDSGSDAGSEQAACTRITLVKEGGIGGLPVISVEDNVVYLGSTCATELGGGFSAPTQTGYTFDGYYTLKTGGVQCMTADGTLTGKCTLTGENTSWHAHWTSSATDTFSVTYKLPEGVEWVSGYTPTTTVTNGSSFVLPDEEKILVTNYNLASCGSYAYWCYKQSNGDTKCVTAYNSSLTADEVADLSASSDKTIYFSVAKDEADCDLNLQNDIQPWWNDNYVGCSFKSEQDYDIWCKEG